MTIFILNPKIVIFTLGMRDRDETGRYSHEVMQYAASSTQLDPFTSSQAATIVPAATATKTACLFMYLIRCLVEI
jgi:hypothetical protein